MKKIKLISSILVIGLFLFSLIYFIMNKTYKVVFIDDNNVVLETRYIKTNTHIEYNIPTKIGYTFIYWTLDGEKYNDSNFVKSNLTLKANYKLTDDELLIVTYKYSDNEETVYVKTGEKLVDSDKRTCYLNGALFNFDEPVSDNLTLDCK